MECVRQAGDVTLEQGMNLEAKSFGVLRDTEDFSEGTKAFLETPATVSRSVIPALVPL